MRLLQLCVLGGGLALAAIVACGTTSDSQFNDGSSGTSGTSGTPPGFALDDGSVDPSGQNQPFDITPAESTVTFTTGAPAPTVQYSAKLRRTGAPVPAVFSIDRGEIGTVDASTGLFTASGAAGGKAKITAAWNGATATATVTVKLKTTQNGGTDTGPGGAGGRGGVGGDPSGGPVSPDLVNVLRGTPTADANLKMLYPYDGTVWPRGLLAPLLQWKPGDNYDAVLIRLQENHFEFEGTFAKNATPFKNHVLPQDAWKQMALSNEGEEVTVTLVFAKGTQAFGPLTLKWKIASAPLKGIVYYNSYGTKLAKNFDGALPEPKSKFGGATLAIRGNSTDPTLIAGGDGDRQYCRVCHSVAANGAALITQRADGRDRKFSAYDLKTKAETTMAPEGGNADTRTATYSWPAIYPDGSIFLGDSSSADGSQKATNKLYPMPTGAGPVTPTAITTNWPATLRAAFPAFSPDGKNLAFTVYAQNGTENKRTLATMTFDRATNTFGAVRTLYTPPNAAHSALYPAFLPTNDGLVFHVETRNNGRDFGGTRSDEDVAPPDPDASIGARAELWWVNMNGSPRAVRLDKLNGRGYLPTGPAGHDDDATLNYEPTVNPVPSGGYAWVVFTSRRLYGNVSTINPFYSDPRYHDLTQNPTPKKLWVAAVDLNAPPGTDPSHPAFYLPAQELLAGNSRGYWVVDPCRSDGNDCESGDECCGGYCRPDPNRGNKLTCSNTVPTCAQEFEKCTTAADCCVGVGLSCINGRCAIPTPK